MKKTILDLFIFIVLLMVSNFAWDNVIRDSESVFVFRYKHCDIRNRVEFIGENYPVAANLVFHCHDKSSILKLLGRPDKESEIAWLWFSGNTPTEEVSEILHNKPDYPPFYYIYFDSKGVPRPETFLLAPDRW